MTTRSGSPTPTAAPARLDRLWPARRPVIMGIVNTTPDSFSDGGRFLDPDAAVREGGRHLDAGAVIVDIGGESTRPGAAPVSADEESRRVLPVVERLRRRHPDAVLSIDTSKPAVARAALAAGADLVNDVSAATEPGMLELVAGAGAGIVLMHRRGTPGSMQSNTRYDDVVAEVHGLLRERAAAALSAGIPADRIWLDPGIGFGKDDPGNLALLAASPALSALGHPIVVGASRKSFIGRLTDAGVDDRLPGSLAALIPVVGLDRVVVRVHEPGPTRQFLELALRVAEAAA